MEPIFERPPAHALGGSYLAEVVSVQDPDNLSRVQVRIYNADGISDHDAPLWARVAVPFAGPDMGAFFIPNVGDEVLVSFVNADYRFPIVMGSLWNGAHHAPETLSGSQVDRWSFVGKNGTRIAIVEQSASEETISLTTPNETVSGTFTMSSGGKIEFKIPGTTIKLDTGGVTIETSTQVKVQASTQVQVTAPMVKVDAAMADFSGVVKCNVLQATTVIGTTYTPGVGNIW